MVMAKATGWGAPLRHFRELFGRGSAVGITDGQLLTRYAATGDDDAFEALVFRHGPMVAATCRAILRDEHDAEDAFQATFLILARKARSIRADAALGGWLHRIAYRAAVQASIRAKRRRREETEAGLMTVRGRAETGDVEEARRLVHEEIDRLPERLRLPVVLRDLQGLSYAEAASRLGLTEPALRTRLARGRERLRCRLSSRGITASIVSTTVACPLLSARAAVPMSWSKAAVASATGATAPTGAALIAKVLIKGMLMTRIKLITGAVLGASLLTTAGTMLAARPAVTPPAPLAATPPPLAPRKAMLPKAAREEETVSVHGIVLDPDGRPVPGAAVASSLTLNGKPVRTTAGPDGRFAIVVSKKIFNRLPAGLGPVYSWLTASAPGFGFGDHEPAGRATPMAEQFIRLVADGVPIEGRLLDLEGRPVAGARVEVNWAYYDPKSPGDLSPWLGKMRSGAVRGIWQDLQRMQVEIETTTDADGRFGITGVGHDRVADLAVSGPTIARTEALVLTRDEPEIRASEKGVFGSPLSGRPLIVHAPRFEIAAPPTRPIEGVFRDQETGAPISGVEIKGMVYDEASLVYPEGINAKTDAEGRFRLTGLAHGHAYRLEIIPPEDSLYLRSSRKVEASEPTGPVMFDFSMKRGAIVRGRVVEKGTHRPVVGKVEVASFSDTARDEYPGAFSGYAPSAELDREGRFTIATLPGRGLLLVRADDVLYRGARGYESIPGYMNDTGYGYFNTRPLTTHPNDYHAIAEIKTDLTTNPEPIEIEVDPGLTVKLRSVDPEGRPIGGTIVRGLGELFSTSPFPIKTPEFEVHGLDPSNPRRVVVTHEPRKLIGSVYLKGNEQGTVEVRLQPWGIVAGRVVDDEGKPVASVKLQSIIGIINKDKNPKYSYAIPGADWNSGIALPDDGRFHVEGLVPGLKYGASATNTQYAGGVLFQDVIVRPGEVTDLGDLKLTPFKREN